MENVNNCLTDLQPAEHATTWAEHAVQPLSPYASLAHLCAAVYMHRVNVDAQVPKSVGTFGPRSKASAQPQIVTQEQLTPMHVRPCLIPAAKDHPHSEPQHSCIREFTGISLDPHENLADAAQCNTSGVCIPIS